MTDLPPLADNPFFVAEREAASVWPKKPRKPRPDGSFYSNDKALRLKQLHEDGKIPMGPPDRFALAPPPRARNRRAAEVIRDMAAEEADKIKAVFLDGIDETQPIGVRLQAAKEILKVESEEEQLVRRRQQQEFENLNKVELVDSIMDVLDRLRQAGQIASGTDADVIDAEVVEGNGA